jgi:hypothetical protein
MHFGWSGLNKKDIAMLLTLLQAFLPFSPRKRFTRILEKKVSFLECFYSKYSKT